MNYRVIPDLVVLPESAEQVQQIVKTCYDEGIPFVARGSGTGLSGGALPVESGVLIVLTRMRRILEVDIPNERVVVEPGVINIWVSQEVADEGYYYAPDPASQIVSSIGGNLAENSGGVHCLKYGFTTNHVMGAEVVLPDGSMVHIGGGKSPDAPGYELLGAFVGSEGTLGIATKITLRILRKPEAVRTLLAAFKDTEEAGGAVSGIIGGGIVPAAIEMMDALTIEAVEKQVAPGFPEAGAILIVELDGPEAEVANQFEQVIKVCEENDASEIRVAEDDEERALFWKGRKAAFGAMGSISNDYYVQDGVVPRTELGAVLKKIADLSEEYGLQGRQRLPRRGRQPPPARPLRQRRPRRGREGRGARRRTSSSPAWSTAARSRASTASGGTRRSTCPRCSPRTTWTSCSSSGAPSTRTGSATRARSSRPPACAANAPAPSTCTRSRRPASRRTSDADAERTHGRAAEHSRRGERQAKPRPRTP